MLTIVEKLWVIDMLESGVPTSIVSKQFGIAKQTISDIKRNKERIRHFSGKLDSTRKNLKFPGHARLEEAVYDWYLKQQGREIRGPEIQAKAEIFAKELNMPNFSASNGWLWRFKKRHGIDSRSANLTSHFQSGKNNLP